MGKDCTYATERLHRNTRRFFGPLHADPKLVKGERQLVRHLVGQLGRRLPLPMPGAGIDAKEDGPRRIPLGLFEARGHLAGVHGIHAVVALPGRDQRA